MTDWQRNRHVVPSLLDAIGQTPLVRLARIPEREVEILVKLEWYGPSGSLKDRVYAHLFDAAERYGELRPGMTVLECSTGNAGTACALVAAVRGYRCIVVMPEGMSEERKKLMAAYGAELVFTPGGESDVDLALARLEQIRASEADAYWVPAQFSNAENPVAHEQTTGPEIWEQSRGAVDAFVASQGTGGCVTGVGRFLRARRPDVRLYAVEPAECPIIAHSRWGAHGIEGIGDGFIPENLDLGLLDGAVTISTRDSIATARRLAAEEGLFCGISSGCNVAACLKVAREHPELRTIVTMLNDTGQRYFTTPLCDDEQELDVPTREHDLDTGSVRALQSHRARLEIVE